jgi:phage FluMu gp28-like protein
MPPSNQSLPPVIPLRPYQQWWVDDPSRFKIAVKSARIGFSFGTALEVVLDCLANPKTTWTILSASKPQSVEFIETCNGLLQAMGGTAQLYQDEDFYDVFGKIEAIQARITLSNGARIIALPANPRTARGYPGNAVLDEFAHHEDSYAIWAAITRQVSLGHKVRVLSTPNGEQGKFYDLCKELGLTDGEAPAHNFQMYKGWSCFWINADMAIEQGCPINMTEMRELIKDDDIVNQEFYCVFIPSAGAWLPLELIHRCEDPASTLDWPFEYQARGSLYGGIDVGRSQDQTVFILKEKLGDVLWTRMVLPLHSMPLTKQYELLDPYVARTRITAMDSTGMGIGLFDLLNQTNSGRIMGVNFAGSSRLRQDEKQKRSQSTGSGSADGAVRLKTDLAIKLKKSMEDAKERLPYDLQLRTELQAIKRVPTATGVTFDAPRVAIETGVAGGKKQKGFAHADRFWAFALATYAASGTPLQLGMTPSDIQSTYSQSRGFM